MGCRQPQGDGQVDRCSLRDLMARFDSRICNSEPGCRCYFKARTGAEDQID
jgi:hypothetical protein